MRAIHNATRLLGIEQHFVTCGYKSQNEDTAWIEPNMFATFRLMDSNPITIAKTLADFRAWLRRLGITVVHVHHRRLAALLCSCKAILGCRVLYTGNLCYPFAAWFWPVHPDYATAVTNDVAANMRATMRVREVSVISNAVNFAEQPNWRSDKTDVDAVCIGRLEPVKGQEHLIRAWGILRNQGYRAKLAIVGEGSQRDRLVTLTSECGVTGDIEFRGFRRDVPGEVRRSRFGILASQVEGQGIVVIEAAASGRASLLTNVDGLRDCLPPDRSLPNGVDFGNPAALAETLKIWLDNHEAVRREGEVFYDFFRQTSSIEFVGCQYAQLYRQLSLR